MQARFEGYKIRQWRLVPGSQAGAVRSGGNLTEVDFDFPGDAPVRSVKPIGYNHFGIWRWEALSLPDQVRASVRHTNGHDEIVSIYGWYQVPADIPDCGGDNADN